MIRAGTPRAGTVETATRRAVMARDAGLRRIAAVTRWTVAAVVVLSGALALIAAKAFHGHTVTSTPNATQTTTPAITTPATTTPANTNPAIQQPAQAPAPIQQAPVAISGGS
jgi:hypothetical protein